MALNGIDASRHQGTINWDQVAAAGNRFAFIKATQSTSYDWVDWYRVNARKVRDAGMILGAYHFLVDHRPGADQARYFVQVVGSFNGVVPIVDIERESDGTTPDERHLRDFVNEFWRLIPGRQILIYTGKWYWVGVIGNPFGADLGPLWHSEYDGTSPIDFEVADGPELDVYGGWSECKVWQYTSSGSVPGIAGSCDRNLFYGTETELLALAGTTPQEDDTLSAAEVEEIKKHINQAVRPYFAQDYNRAAELGEDIVWVVWKDGTKTWVPQPGDTAAEQEAPGKSLMNLDHVWSDGTYPNGYPKPWQRSKAELDVFETRGPVPPGWET